MRQAVNPDGTRRLLTDEEIATIDAARVAAQAVTPDMINAERDRRLRAGRSFTVTGHATPIRLTGDATTRDDLSDLKSLSSDAIALGAGSETVDWRDADNVIHTLTHVQLVELFHLSAAYYGAVKRAAWPLKDAPSIPANYDHDDHWPSKS